MNRSNSSRDLLYKSPFVKSSEYSFILRACRVKYTIIIIISKQNDIVYTNIRQDSIALIWQEEWYRIDSAVRQSHYLHVISKTVDSRNNLLVRREQTPASPRAVAHPPTHLPTRPPSRLYWTNRRVVVLRLWPLSDVLARQWRGATWPVVVDPGAKRLPRKPSESLERCRKSRRDLLSGCVICTFRRL